MSRYLDARLAVAAGFALAMGCTSFQRTAARPAPGRTVQVQFARPRDLDVSLDAGARASLGATRAVRGRVLAVREDTLVLQISSWRAPGAWTPQSPPVVVSVPLVDPELSFAEDRFSPEVTMIALIGIPAVLLAFSLAIYLAVGPVGGT